MPLRQPGWSKSRAELLMDITAGLADLTQRPDDVDRVPAYLSGRLALEPLTLALIREHAEGPEAVLSASSGALATAPDVARDVVAAHQRKNPARQVNGSAPHSGDGAPSESTCVIDLPHPDFPRATLFSQRVDIGFHMLLIVHHRGTDAPLNGDWIETLQAIAKQTAKFLAGITIWLYRPAGMGAPFDRLTNREWMVLRGLSTGACEKQLADQLKLSPHTLHSHIKSIYRKTGVPGRLPLLLSAQEALRALRCQGLNGYGTAKSSFGAAESAKMSHKSIPTFS